jgi:hypothetical protein
MANGSGKQLRRSQFLQDAIATVIGGNVANAGTFTVAYPKGRKASDYTPGPGNHNLHANGVTYKVESGNFTIAFTTVITITWLGGYTLTSGTEVVVGLVRAESVLPDDVDDAPAGVIPLGAHVIDFGSPVVGAVAGVKAITLLAEAGDLFAGNHVFDAPRNFTLTAATTNHSARTVTVYGTDYLGNPMVESRAGPNANTVAGVKAFKTITRVAVDGAVATNGISVGMGEVFGLPFFVPNKGYFLKALVDGVDELGDSTVVGGLATGVSTATSADVRGTIDFNTAANGTRRLQAIVLGGTRQLGTSQFTG